MDEKTINEYIEVRDYMIKHVHEKVGIYMCGMWNPLVKHVLIEETKKIMNSEVRNLFPTVAISYLPKIRFRIYESINEVDAAIQYYYNTDTELTYLGTSMIGDEVLDCYFRDSYDPRFDHTFIVRYGHDEDNIYKGSKTAEAEYFLGQNTPLALAYGIATEDGFI